MQPSETLKFHSYTLPDGKTSLIPDDINLAVPTDYAISKELLHFLVYIPWDNELVRYVPEEYRPFFKNVLPYLHARTTDVHIALCAPFVAQLAAQFPQEIDLRVVYTAFILHDIGWSQLTDNEVAQSLGVKGLALSADAVGPKEKHAIVGKELAEKILGSYAFDPPLSSKQKSLILNAILYHDKPWELAGNGDVPLEVKLVCDVDHLWSFTRQNFWQDTVRKGVEPRSYLANLETDLTDYFITDEAKALAKSLLADRAKELQALTRSSE